MVGLRPHPLSRSIAAWAPFRRSADADRAGNDPARAARATGRVSENRPRPGAHGPDAYCDHCRVLAPVTGASAHMPFEKPVVEIHTAEPLCPISVVTIFRKPTIA